MIVNKHQDGYTLIEVMTALVLLFIILLPTSYVISYLLTDDNGRNQIVAANLAEAVMEQTLLEKQFAAQSIHEEVNGQRYRVERVIGEQTDLLRIDVLVYHKEEDEPLLAIYRYVIKQE